MREILVNLGVQVLNGLGCETIARCGRLTGRLAWRLLGSRRKLAAQAIAFHLEKDRNQAATIAKHSFVNNFQSFFEIAAGRRVDWRFARDRVTIAQPERLAALAQGTKPAMIATGHFGSWEIMNWVLALHLARRDNIVVMRWGKDRAMNEFMRKQRVRSTSRILGHRNTAPELLKCMRAGGVTAFLVDHNTLRQEAIFLPFLRDMAAVNAGPALLAVRAKAQVWPVFMVRKPKGHYELRVDEPLDTAGLAGSVRERVRQTAEFYTQAVESVVREYPEQWFWMHKRWKTRPESKD